MSRLSDRAKRALSIGGSEAVRLRRDRVEPEHVLIGLLCCGDSTVERALAAVEVGRARQLVDELVGAGEVLGQIDAVTPSASTRGVVDRAATEADRLTDVTIEPRHVLLALVDEQGVAHVLDAFGISRGAIRRQLLGGSEA
jgi:ATP-dependent Clp protease ATP-binding subunit ClpA